MSFCARVARNGCLDMKIIELNKHRDFIALEQTWNDVLQRCDHTIFQTWEWLSTWWKHFGNNKKLLLLLAEEKDEILGIAPLMYSVHKMFGLRIGKIEFIGTPDSDYHDFILTEKEKDCIELFVNHLKKLPEKWDCIELTDIPENSKSSRFLSKLSKKFDTVHKCPYGIGDKSAVFRNRRIRICLTLHQRIRKWILGRPRSDRSNEPLRSSMASRTSSVSRKSGDKFNGSK